MAKKNGSAKSEPKIQAEGTTGSKTWSGYITTGPISIPVAMYAAARSESMGFNMLHQLCHSRLKQVLHCPCCVEVEVLKPFLFVPMGADPTFEGIELKKGDRRIMHAQDAECHALAGKVNRTDATVVVERSDTLKGYEYAKDTYAIFTKEEIEAQKPASASAIHIDKFVKAEEVHPIYFESSYYLPADDAVKNRAYSMLREGLIRTGTVAVGKVCVRQSENVVFIYPDPRGGLLAFTAYLADEVRQIAFQPPAKLSPEELKAVTAYIEANSGALEMSEYRDSYREALTKLIEAKKNGETIKAAEAPKPKSPQSDNLIEMFQLSTKLSLEKRQKKTA